MSDSYNKLISETAAPSRIARPRPERRWILVLLLLGLASTLALTTLAGNARTFALLWNANLFFVALVAIVQALRYVAMAISTGTVARIVAMRVPFFQMFEVTVAAQAANRTFVGGAAGFLIRLDFFLKRGLNSGTFMGVETIEDVVSLVAISLLFLSGLAIFLANGAGAEFRWDVLGWFAVAVSLFVLGVIAFLRRPVLVERAADALVRAVNRTVGRLLRRNWYHPERIRGAVHDFYRALTLAKSDPPRVSVAFLCALARLGCDAIALYFCFRAVGYDAAPGIVLLIFVVSSSVSTIAAVPGQIGVMETTLSLMSTSLGVPLPIAVSATLLYRLISFWLPIPLGYAFAWDLQRRGLL